MFRILFIIKLIQELTPVLINSIIFENIERSISEFFCV